MVKTIKAAGGGGVSLDGPTGIHIIPGSRTLASGDQQIMVPLHKDTTGKPDRCVVVSILTTSTIALAEYQLIGGSWVFLNDSNANDASVTLTVTAAAQTDIGAFAIDSPEGSGDRVLFISTNDGAQTPDTFEINSIVLTVAGAGLTAVVAVIAGTNQPTDTNGMATANIPLSTTRLMTFFEDDAHFADITESSGTYTFTYDDAKVTTVDTDIGIGTAGQYSGIIIGSQVVMAEVTGNVAGNKIWEMTTGAVVTEEFDLTVGAMATFQSNAMNLHPQITAIGGKFAMAGPIGGGDATGDEAAYLVTSFELDSF